MLGRQTHLRAPRAEVPLHQGRRENVDAGGHGRVDREDRAGRAELAGLLEVETILLHEDANPLEGQEGAVPLVHVIGPGAHPESIERAQPPHAEDDLLLDTALEVASVELVRDVLYVARVLGQVRIQQDERHAADLRAPELHERRAAGEVDGDAHRLAARIAERLHRHGREIVDRVALLLPSIGAQVLSEVPLLVEDADADERKPQVARGLEMIAREDAETARVDRQALGDAEFHRKVRDLVIAGRAEGLLMPGAFTGHVAAEPRDHPVEMREERFVLRGLEKPFLGDRAQQQNGVVVGVLPEVAAEPPEQADRLVIPRPAEVVGQLLEGAQPLGQ